MVRCEPRISGFQSSRSPSELAGPGLAGFFLLFYHNKTYFKMDLIMPAQAQPILEIFPKKIMLTHLNREETDSGPYSYVISLPELTLGLDVEVILIEKPHPNHIFKKSA